MLVTVLTIAELVYVVGLGAWILVEKRSPVATLAWILALIALPYVGFVVFFFVGPRRIRRKRLRHKRARGAAIASVAPEGSLDKALDAPEIDAREAQLVRLATRTGEPPIDRAEAVTVLADAATTYDAIEAAVRAAKHHVHVAYYILDPGRAGTRLRDALVERAKAGVTVRVLVDHVGSSALTRAWVSSPRGPRSSPARQRARTSARDSRRRSRRTNRT